MQFYKIQIRSQALEAWITLCTMYAFGPGEALHKGRVGYKGCVLRAIPG